ncbi:MAG: FtsX-like permease family protein [Bacteroidota bacterium]
MFSNFLVISARLLKRYPSYTLINVGGLGIGLAACLCMLLFVAHERSYDQFHPSADELYRVHIQDTSVGSNSSQLPEMIVPQLVSDYPAITAGARVSPAYKPMLLEAEEGARKYEAGFVQSESAFFELFTVGEVLYGSVEGALDTPDGAVITDRAALKHFGTANAVGKTFATVDEELFDIEGFEKNNRLSFADRGLVTYQVRAVVASMPSNSSIQFEVLTPLVPTGMMQWNISTYDSYVRIPNAHEVASLEAQMPAFAERYNNLRPEETTVVFQPLADVHLNPSFGASAALGGPRLYLTVFSVAAFLLLLIGCINYMNLATARAARRAREVGVRKALGASRPQLIAQFFGEALVAAVGALAVGLVLAALALPAFNAVVGIDLSLGMLATPFWVVTLGSVVLLMAFVSGLYPALHLSHYRPVRVLKGGRLHERGRLRQGLVVVQFAASVLLVFATVVVDQQLTYVRDAQLNIKGEQVIVVDNERASLNRAAYEDFRNELMGNPAVSHVAWGELPGRVRYGSSAVFGDDEENTMLSILFVEDEYLDALELTLVEGTNFEDALYTDKDRLVLINETAAQLYQGDDPLMSLERSKFNGGRVVGILEDFHVQPLNQEIKPVVLVHSEGSRGTLLVRSAEGRTAEALAAVETAWAARVADRPLTFSFLDDTLDEAYQAERRLGNVFSLFAFLTTIVACLGLFGLAAFAAEQRTKEVGIRKVLGASMTSLVQLLSVQLLKQVTAAVVLAFPIGYLLLDAWLDDFPYRIDIGIGLLLVLTLAMLVVAWGTIAYQVITTARANPVRALRYE